MRKIWTAIVDDDREFTERLCNMVEQTLWEREISSQTDCFAAGESLLARLEEGACYDIYLILMSGLLFSLRNRVRCCIQNC